MGLCATYSQAFDYALKTYSSWPDNKKQSITDSSSLYEELGKAASQERGLMTEHLPSFFESEIKWLMKW